MWIQSNVFGKGSTLHVYYDSYYKHLNWVSPRTMCAMSCICLIKQNLKVNFKTDVPKIPIQLLDSVGVRKVTNLANITSEAGKKRNLGGKTQNGSVSVRRNSRATP